MTVRYIPGHNCVSNKTNKKLVYLYYKSNISDTIKAISLKRHNGRLVHGIHAHAHFDDLDLEGRSQWVGRGKTTALNYLDN